jgi:hypothetical protein
LPIETLNCVLDVNLTTVSWALGESASGLFKWVGSTFKAINETNLVNKNSEFLRGWAKEQGWVKKH